MELRQVRAFVEIARTASFARAAEHLGVGKAGLSKQVRALEAELGVELLVRGGGRHDVALTPAGEALLPHALAAVQALDDGVAAIGHLAGPRRGRVRLVVGQGWEAWPGWEDMLAGFHRAHPGISLEIDQARTLDGSVEQVARGERDLAILAGTHLPQAPGVSVEVLHQEPLAIALPPRHRLAGRPKVTLEDLAGESWLLPPVEHEIVAGLGAATGFTPRVDIQPANVAMVRSLVLSGDGIGVLGASEAGFYQPAPVVPLVPEVVASIAVAWRAATGNAATRTVRDALRRQFGVAPPP